MKFSIRKEKTKPPSSFSQYIVKINNNDKIILTESEFYKLTHLMKSSCKNERITYLEYDSENDNNNV